MKLFNNILFLLCFISFSSCEEVIDLDLKNVNPKYVIEADLPDVMVNPIIKVSQTVNVDEEVPSKPINNATVVVTDTEGKEHIFTSIGDGKYQKSNFGPNRIGKYSLKVSVDDEEFVSSTERVPYVSVDSLGIKGEEIFNEYYYIITFKFNDPKDEVNYYKYSYSVNGAPFKFASVMSDKFNNGLYVTHEITERDEKKKFKLGDIIVVRRECISKDVYTFWNQLQGLNPGSAAPANPDSNISNGALGYFNVSSAKLYEVKIEEAESVN